MTVAPKIDIHNLESVRAAAKTPDLVLGDDWVAPQPVGEGDLDQKRRHRSLLALRRSPIARKIITFNLIAMMLLIAGVLFINSSRDTLAYQRAVGLVAEAELIADVFEGQLPAAAPVNLASGDGIDVQVALDSIDLSGGIFVGIFDVQGNLIATSKTSGAPLIIDGIPIDDGATFFTDLLNSAWTGVASVFGATKAPPAHSSLGSPEVKEIVAVAISGRTSLKTLSDLGDTRYVVASPVMQAGKPVGVVAVQGAAGELDGLLRREREKVLRLFLVGLAISVLLSLILASTIANPLADLAAAAEKLAATKTRVKCRRHVCASLISAGDLMKSGASPARYAAWLPPFMSASKATNNSRPTWPMKSRTRLRPCGLRSAHCAWPNVTINVRHCLR